MTVIGLRRGPHRRIHPLGYPPCSVTNPPNQRPEHDVHLHDLAPQFKACMRRIPERSYGGPGKWPAQVSRSTFASAPVFANSRTLPSSP